MKKVTESRARDMIKGKTLLKYAADPTHIYVFAGHPRGEYSGEIAWDRLILQSLTTGEFRNTGRLNNEEIYLVENEDDVLDAMGKIPVEQPTLKERISNAFGKLKI